MAWHISAVFWHSLSTYSVSYARPILLKKRATCCRGKISDSFPSIFTAFWGPVNRALTKEKGRALQNYCKRTFNGIHFYELSFRGCTLERRRGKRHKGMMSYFNNFIRDLSAMAISKTRGIQIHSAENTRFLLLPAAGKGK